MVWQSSATNFSRSVINGFLITKVVTSQFIVTPADLLLSRSGGFVASDRNGVL